MQSAPAEIFPSCRDRSKEATMATTFSFSSVVFDNSIRKVFARGFMPKGTERWATTTVRYHDAAMRYFTAEPSAIEIAFEGLTLIEGEPLEIMMVICKDGNVYTTSKEAWDAIHY